MSSAKFDKMSEGFQRLFSTPSLMKGEDPDIYAELYARVEEVVQPNDVWDQMMVADIANHFWEQQRYRRCTGTIINSKRRAALETILRKEIGLNSGDAQSVAQARPSGAFEVEKELQIFRDPKPGIERLDARGCMLLLRAQAVRAAVEGGERRLLLTDEVGLDRQPKAIIGPVRALRLRKDKRRERQHPKD